MEIEILYNLIKKFKLIHQQENENVESFYVRLHKSGKIINKAYKIIKKYDTEAIERFSQSTQKNIESTFKSRLIKEIKDKISPNTKFENIILQAIKIEKEIKKLERKQNLFSIYAKRRRI